jgi:hypothetical protein
MNININCEWENSKINPKIRICKHCRYVCSTTNNSEDNRICPSLISQVASNPEYQQVRLEKVSLVKPDGSIEEQIITKPEKTKPDLDAWWADSATETPAISAQSVLSVGPKNLPPQSQQMQTQAQVKVQNTTEQQGKPCSQEQIDARLAICQGCEFYKNNSCLKCGCALSRDRNYMNKLYWADKSCPIGKWGPVE